MLALHLRSPHAAHPSASSGKASGSRGRGKAAAAAAQAAPAPAAEDRPLGALLRLLCTLSHPQRAMRCAGLEAVQALQETLGRWWAAGGEGMEVDGAGEAAQPAASQEQVEAILSAVLARRAAVEADAEAFEAMVQRTLGLAPAVAAPPAAPGTAAKKGRGSGRRKASAGEEVEPGSRPQALPLSAAEASALCALLLAALPAQRGPAGLHAAATALRCAAEAAPPADALLAGAALLRTLGSFAAGAGGAALAPLSQQEAELAADLLSLFTPVAVREALERDAAAAGEALRCLLRALALQPQQAAGSAAAAAEATVRLAALRAMEPELFVALPPGVQQDALMVGGQSVHNNCW